MLTETARNVCLNAIAKRARTIKRGIDRILSRTSFEEIAAIAAAVPMPDSPDWDLCEHPHESSEIGWWHVWNDTEDLTVDPDMPFQSTNLNDTGERLVDSLSPTNGIFRESSLQDEDSDAKSLARLVEKFRIHMDFSMNGTARQTLDTHRHARDSIKSENKSGNGPYQAMHTSENLENRVMPTITIEPRSHDYSAHLQTQRLAVTNGDKSSLNLPPKDETHNIIVYDQYSAKHHSEVPNTSAKERFVQLRDEDLRLQSLFKLLKSQESISTHAGRRRIQEHRLRRKRYIGHPLRQSITMEEHEARPDKTLGSQSHTRRVRW
ncbi:hypothetical protein LY76DRAFT_617755 [Colletotrichum caudatum]|nr:hypothetical protein LY76DRAFT_617755 [Colletotrichum caudatum]